MVVSVKDDLETRGMALRSGRRKEKGGLRGRAGDMVS